jgi:NADH dehydrogenase
MAERIATVFGASGFIGRYVVKRLAAQGYHVRVAVRDTESAQFLKPMGAVGQVVLLHAAINDAEAVTRAVGGAEVVVNLVGILAEKKPGDFNRIHEDGAGLVASIAAAQGVKHLVQLSALGASAGSPSAYAKSKAAGEAAVHKAFAGAVILRPSVVFGYEDGFFNRFARMAQLLPMMPVFAAGTKFQPVYVGDVADAVIAGLRPEMAGRIFELGGPAAMSMREILDYVQDQTDRVGCMLPVPMWYLGLCAMVLEKLPGQLLTRDQLVLLGRDNVLTAGVPGLPELGITPTPVAAVVPDYLRRYRPGGGKMDRRSAL